MSEKYFQPKHSKMEYQAKRENPPTMKRSKFSWRGCTGHRLHLTWHIIRK